MVWIELAGVTKKFGTTIAVSHLDLAIAKGEFLTLLGPSGCGKTTVLRMIAGLELPDEGIIRINDRTVFSSEEGIFVPPGRREVGLVFQSYALWPHLSVLENVAFGLQVQKVERGELEKRVHKALDYMQLGGLESRRPEQLSGGQQQRVALARMLVTRPSTFLMDEPLSNLDAKLRMEMRAEIKRLHKQSKATTIYVTHDQNEALTLSTRIAVMNRGAIQQVAPPVEIYRRPSNLFVADFIGSPTVNLISGKVVEHNGRTYFDSAALRIPAAPLAPLVGRPVVAAIRPEDIQIVEEQTTDCLAGEVYSVLPAGAEVVVQVRKDGLVFNIRRMSEVALEMEDKVFLHLPFESMLFYDGDHGDLLYPEENG